MADLENSPTRGGDLMQLLDDLQEQVIELAAIKQAATDFVSNGLITNTTLVFLQSRHTETTAPVLKQFTEREYLAFQHLKELLLD